LLVAVLVAVGYYAGTRLGFSLTPAHQPISTFWPPNALLLAALILAPPRMWLFFLLTVLPAHLIAQYEAGVPALTALGWFVGNAGEALIGAAFIRHFRKERVLFRTVQGLMVYLLFGVLIAPLVTSFLDAAVVMLTGQGSDYWRWWVTRISSNAIADLTLAPTLIVLALGAMPWKRRVNFWRYVEACLLAGAVVSVTLLVFGTGIVIRNHAPILICGLLPILLWAAVRFGPGALSASMLVIAVVSAWNATHGRGLFASALMEENVSSLKVFLSVLTVPLLALAVVLTERRSKEDLLRDTRRKLVRAREQARHRFARTLHDDVAQQLTLLGVEVGQLRIAADASIRQRLDRVYDQVSHLSEATRDLSHDLYPFELEYLGLVPALRKLCARIAGPSGIAVSFIEENVSPQLDSNISLCVYCLAQEALQNVTKRGRAHTVAVTLVGSSKQITLRIADDGLISNAAQQSNEYRELAGSCEQVMVFGGSVRTKSVGGEGTIIEASLPLSTPA
jgi:signal transduction histidine kinase